MTEQEAVTKANLRQRNMSDAEVLAYFNETDQTQTEILREVLTNHFYDELVGYD